MRIGNRDFPIGERTFIMGILNVTPDSFSDGGEHYLKEKAIEHARRMLEEGADILDIGGESTRPNYTVISEEEEIERVIPVIEAIRRETDIPISIDTYKSRVARAACMAGADMVNDIWGLKYDADMAAVVKEQEAAVCIMHNRKSVNYQDFYKEFILDLQESIDFALKAGISRDSIIVDPGIGFAKTYELNLSLINSLEIMKELGFPILLGASRKSVVGLTINEPADNRLGGTLATSVLAVMKGAHFIRVHDVKENLQAVRMTEAILRSAKLVSDSKKTH